MRGVALSILFAVGCDPQPAEQPAEEPAEPSPSVGVGGPAIGVPPLLGEGFHPGWTNPHCDGCHLLPAAGHTVTERYVCAQCHGANGACLTNGYNAEYNEHTPDDDCNGCHVDAETMLPGNHGFTESAVCANCHFRELGQRPCEDYVPPPLPDDSGDEPEPGVPPPLPDDLVTDCYGFPTTPFGPDNQVPKDEIWSSLLQPGDLAVDFTLPDTNGEMHTLSELLVDGPVWLQLGNYSCPVYQSAVREALNPLVAAEGPSGPYADQIQFVHVYDVEAHPAPPDVSPYGNGSLNQYSTVEQPVTFDERLANAQQMEPIVEGELMLVDGLGDELGNNPVWCTYATCPACSYLIGRDGYIYEVITRTPADLADLTAPLDAFLATQSVD